MSMNQPELVFYIHRWLHQRRNEKTAAGAKRFFKEKINPRGIKVPIVRSLEKELWKKYKTELSLEFCLSLTEKLFETTYWEDPVVGMGLVRRFEKEFDESTFKRFEKWVDRYVSNWAHCDDLCTHLIAPAIKKNPKLVKRLISWTTSKNRWKRRASIVPFVPLAKHGYYSKEILRISKLLLADQKDDLVHKANGWTLREFGKFSQPKLLAFLKKNREQIPRVTMHYALERTPKNLKKGL